MPRQGAYAVVCEDGRIGTESLGKFPTHYLKPTATYAGFSEILAIEPTPAGTTRRIGVLQNGVLVGLSYLPEVIMGLDTVTRIPVTVESCPMAEWFDLGQAPGGEAAVLVGDQGTVTILDPGPPLRCGPSFTLDDASSADVDSSGEQVVVGAQETLYLLSSVGSLHWRVEHPARIYDVSISADGRWVATGGGDHNARLFDARTGKLRAVFPGHGERVVSVDIRSDGRMLATGSWDGTARLWGLDILDVPAAELDRRAESDWGLSLEQALDAAGR